jgi:ferritin-like metal-binding protein YciE
MPMNDPRELFLHELRDVYYVENALVKALPEMSSEASDTELARGLDKHLKETREQVKNLEQVFAKLGEKPQGERCPGFDGIKEEHDEFMQKEQPSSEICDMFLTGAAARTEHYEIAAYTGLVAAAQALGNTEAANLLEENLAQEQAMLEKATTAHNRLVGAPRAAF